MIGRQKRATGGDILNGKRMINFLKSSKEEMEKWDHNSVCEYKIQQALSQLLMKV